MQQRLRNPPPKATEFDEITQTWGLLRRSRSPNLIPIESSYATSY